MSYNVECVTEMHPEFARLTGPGSVWAIVVQSTGKTVGYVTINMTDRVSAARTPSGRSERMTASSRA